VADVVDRSGCDLLQVAALPALLERVLDSADGSFAGPGGLGRGAVGSAATIR
jgi:hypothetical protein